MNLGKNTIFAHLNKTSPSVLSESALKLRWLERSGVQKMAKRYNIVTRCIAALALVFVYFVSTSAILVGASTTTAQARGGRGGGGRGFGGGGFRGGGFRGGGFRGRGFGRGFGVGIYPGYYGYGGSGG